MKALITSVLSLALIIGVWLAYYSYSSDTLAGIMYSCEEEVIPAMKEGDWDTARTQFSSQYSGWKNYRRVALYFLDTEKVNSADATFARALEYIDEEDASNGRGEVLSLKEELSALFENEKPLLTSIF